MIMKKPIRIILVLTVLTLLSCVSPLNVEKELFHKSDILEHIGERNRIMSRVVEDED